MRSGAICYGKILTLLSPDFMSTDEQLIKHLSNRTEISSCIAVDQPTRAAVNTTETITTADTAKVATTSAATTNVSTTNTVTTKAATAPAPTTPKATTTAPNIIEATSTAEMALPAETSTAKTGTETKPRKLFIKKYNIYIFVSFVLLPAVASSN